MRYIVQQQPIIPQYIPPQAMGYLGQTQPISTSSKWLLGLTALGLFLWATSERKHSKLF